MAFFIREVGGLALAFLQNIFNAFPQGALAPAE
jgi:hypothetical protein